MNSQSFRKFDNQTIQRTNRVKQLSEVTDKLTNCEEQSNPQMTNATNCPFMLAERSKKHQKARRKFQSQHMPLD